MKNIVFDLGGVLFARDKSKCTPELLEFFSFLRAPRMPLFWEEYDRGTSTLEEVTATISGMTGRPVETCAAVLRLAVDLQEPVKPTERLVGDLKAAGYRLYVLSNMSREFIDFLRRFPVYGLFDGEVVSCEEGGLAYYSTAAGDLVYCTADFSTVKAVLCQQRVGLIIDARWLDADHLLFLQGNENEQAVYLFRPCSALLLRHSLSGRHAV